MKLLLDTHVIVWLFNAPEKIPDTFVTAIQQSNDLNVSVASGWEYELKRAGRPDILPKPFVELLSPARIHPLALPFECHAYAGTLPAIHADPFDRMLVAHALVIGATLVTKDATIRRYPVDTAW